MTTKTLQTAVVLVPPEEAWEPIQAIRREHDHQFRRWMPHVTLLYPFRTREQFDQVEGPLREAAKQIEPFELRLMEFRRFHHGRGHYTLWLAPEPTEGMVRLQSALQSAVPDCDTVSRYRAGFTPHLSVGQVRRAKVLARLEAELQAAWTAQGGLSFVAREVSLIWRGPPPDDLFRVDRTINLGS